MLVIGAFALALFGGGALAAEQQHPQQDRAQHTHAMAGVAHHHGDAYHHDGDNDGGFYCGPAQIALGLCSSLDD
jgi:hypothetical protein